MDKMDTFIILILLVFMVSVNYTTSQSDIGNRSTGVTIFGYNESLNIVSPNYPDNYPNDATTSWLVSGPADYHITAVFKTFHLESGNYDMMRIGSGLDPSNVTLLLANLSGSSLPNDVVSTNNEMWLVFTSDSSVTEQGFEIDIRVFTPRNITALGDGTEVVTFKYGNSLTIVSPNYPANYPNNANDTLLVSGPPDYQIMAVFRSFHLESNCDILRIGSSLDPSNMTSLLASLSGSSLPNVIVSTNNEMWLVFTSDSFSTDQGFRIDISVFTPGNYLASPSLYDTTNTNRYYFSEELDTININLPEIFFADTCFEESCSDETTVCRCDDMCQLFGDCCPDYPLPILNETLTNETLKNENLANETLTNETAMQPINLDAWECITDSFLPQFYPDLKHGYRMISRCPLEWSLDEDIKRKCEDSRSNVTSDVLYVYDDTYFRNLGCATCHGYEESSLTAITISGDQECLWGPNHHTLECMTQTPITQFNMSWHTNESHIYMSGVQTVPKPRLCLFNTTDSCPNGTNDEMARECQYYYKPFISNGIVSKHHVCSQCNGGQLVRCPFTISIEVQAFEDSRIVVEPMLMPAVQVGIIDVFQMPDADFTALQCREGFERVNYECAPIPSDWPFCRFKHIWVTPTNGTEDCLGDMLCSRQVTIDNFTLPLITPPPCLATSSTEVFNDTVTFSLVYEDDMYPSLDTIQRDIIRRVQTLSRDQCENMIISASQSCYVEDNPGNMTDHCPDEVFTGHFLDFTPSLINNESLIFSNGTYIRPRWWSNITDIDFSSANLSSKYQFIMCGTEVALQTCSFFVVSNDSVEWIDQQNQTGIWHQGQMYDIDNILMNPDGSVSICYIDQNTPIGGRALMILGHVLIAISSVCLFATLVTYVAFSPLRNRQGVSIMNFIIALFLGQILLQYVRLSISQFLIPCIVVAALSHFFFLASFVWTTIIAWDLSRSFAASKMKSFSSSSFGRKMVAFLLIGWGIPLVLVLITMVLQFGGFQNVHILEYSSKTCWLAKLASIVMFFIPMSLCLLSNIVLFTITIHGVHSTKKSTSMLNQGQESHLKQWVIELRIYVKISALLGFAWLFGFLAMVINVPFMDYLFLIVISLQGVFIFISFGANKRVRKLWRTSMESSTLWTTLSRREYTRGRSSTGTNSGH